MNCWIIAVVFYFGTGLVLSLSASLHGAISRNKRLTASLALIILWPLLVFFAPESFFRDQPDVSAPRDWLKEQLNQLASQNPPLTDKEAAHLRDVAEGGTASVAFFSGSGTDALQEFWDSGTPPAVYEALTRARAALREGEPDSGIRFSLREPDWYVGFSNEFLKTVSGIDRKLQGRILEAIARISGAPVTPAGDTIKPLTGDLAGLWRVRIGDERLIYYPDAESKQITFISFGPRGNIYGKLPSTSKLIAR